MQTSSCPSSKRRARPSAAKKLAILLLLIAFGCGAADVSFAGPSPRPRKSLRPKTYVCGNKRMTEAQVAAYRGISLTTLRLLHTQRGMTNGEICAIPDSKLARAIARAEHP